MPETFAPELLAELVRAHGLAGGRKLRFHRVPTGKHNTCYYVEGADLPCVLRIAPPDDTVLLFYERRMMAQEPALHALLRERTSVPVPEVLAYDGSRRLIDRDFILLERLPGRPLSALEPTAQQRAQVLRQVGALLAQVHALTAEHWGYLGAHRPMEPEERWESAFAIMWNRLLDDIAAVEGYAPHEEEALRGLLAPYRPFFRYRGPACLLHMDVWQQNILVDEEWRVTGLLDWDRALWGDPECEFAVLDYCAISEPAFWQGYGRSRQHNRPAQIRQRFYLLYELQKYIVIEIGRRGNRAAARYYREEAIRLALVLAGSLP